MLIVRRSTYDRISELYSLERQATTSMQKTLAAFCRDLKAANLELDQLRASLEAAQGVKDMAQRQRDKAQAELSRLDSVHASALEASQEVVAERDRALAREREANQKAHNIATVLTDTERKLGDTERVLDMSRSRREQIGKDLDALRDAGGAVSEIGSTVIRWLLAHSSGGSAADHQATSLRKVLERMEDLLNT